MVNTVFALKFTTPCKLASKCGIYHLCFWFPPSLHFFAPYLHRVNLCKSSFSCSEWKKRTRRRTRVFIGASYTLGERFFDYVNNMMDKIAAIEIVSQWNLCYLWFSTAFLTFSVLSSEVQTDSDSLRKVRWADIC